VTGIGSEAADDLDLRVDRVVKRGSFASVHLSTSRRTISTFSRDIAYAVSRDAI
jgi:hypothetical protein